MDTHNKSSKKLYKIKEESLNKTMGDLNVSNKTELLKLMSPKKGDSTLKSMGVKTKTQIIQKETKEHDTIKVIASKFPENEVYSGSQIKKMCNKHDLRCVSIDSVKGYYPDETGGHIEDFIEKYNLIKRSSSFYVMTNPKFLKKDINKGNNFEVDQFILFYLIENNDYNDYNDYRDYNKALKDDALVQITSHGEDFSDLRILNKYLSFNDYGSHELSKFSCSLILMIPLILLIISLCFNMFVLASISVIGFLIGFNIMFTDFIAHDYWNQTTKI